jgi:subtilisin family serine protease
MNPREEKIIRLGISALLCCLLWTTTPARADGKIAPNLQAILRSMDPVETIAVIVNFASGDPAVKSLRQTGSVARATWIRSLRAATRTHRQNLEPVLRSRGVTRTRSLWLIDSLAVTATPVIIHQLATMESVAGVRLDRRHHKKDVLMALTDAPESNLTQVGAPALWALGYLGQGITVGIMDSGADLEHPDLEATWRGGTNSWLDPYGQYAAPSDTDSVGHGTAVLGIMVGGDAGGTTIGMAPKARWIAARMFDDNDEVTESVIHQIFQWFLDPDGNPDTDDAPDVINGSWGLLDENSQAGACIAEFQPDITALNNAGIATVFAAGNYGPADATGISPANYAGAIAVGAVNGSDAAVAFSSRGPSACDGRIYPDVVAPGVAIKSADRSLGGLPAYLTVSGTSVSAPHASGALALLAGAFPQATLADLKAALLGSAVDLGDAGPDNIYGNGRIAVDDFAGAFAYLRDVLGKSPCVRPEISFSAAPQPGAIGEPVAFTAAVAGGGGPYTYAWDVDGDGAVDGTTRVFHHAFDEAYTGSVRLTVTDTGADDCPSSMVVADQWACPEITAVITAQPDPAIANSEVTLTGTVSGGTAPYTYAWDLDGDGSADCSASACTHTYAAADQIIALTVTDASGCSAASQLTLTVVPMPDIASGSGSGGGGCFIAAAFDGVPDMPPQHYLDHSLLQLVSGF